MNASAANYYIRLDSSTDKPLINSRLAFYKFSEALWTQVELKQVEILAFCLLRQEEHIIIRTQAGSLETVISAITDFYNDWYNLSNHKRGRVFASPAVYSLSIPTQLADTINHLHWLPVLNKLTARPEIYPWSSHQAYINNDDIPWVNNEPGLSAIARHRVSWVRRYLKFMETPITTLPPNLTILSELSGNSDQTEAPKDTGSSEAEHEATVFNNWQMNNIIQCICQEYGMSVAELTGRIRHRLASEARTMAAWLARDLGVGDFSSIANELNADSFLLSHSINELSESRLNYLETIKAKIQPGQIKAGANSAAS